MKDQYGRLEITNQEQGKVTILVDGVIGSSFFEEGVTLKALKNEVERAGKVDTIQLDINSPGGLVDEGMAIYNWLSQHNAQVITNVIGTAASAASFIVQAGDIRKAAKNVEIMIHNAQLGARGDKHVMKKAAQILEQADDLIAMTYEARSNLDRKQITKLMDAETFMTAERALEDGFIDEVVEIKGSPKKVEDYKEQIANLYERWADNLEEAKVADNFDNEYRVAASLIPGWEKPKEKPYAKERFVWKPFDLSSFLRLNTRSYQEDDGSWNINGLRIEAIENPQSERAKLLDVWLKRDSANRKWLQAHKIEIIHNGQIYCYSEKEIKMYNQRIEELEAEVETLKAQLNEAEATAAKPVVDNKEVANLKSAISTLTKTIENMQADREAEKNAEREAVIEKMAAEGYFRDEEDRLHHANLYDISPEAWEATRKELIRKGPQYAHLYDVPGGTTETKKTDKQPEFVYDEEKGTAIAQEVDYKINKIMNDKKINYSEAYEELRNTETELIDKFERGE